MAKSYWKRAASWLVKGSLALGALGVLGETGAEIATEIVEDTYSNLSPTECKPAGSANVSDLQKVLSLNGVKFLHGEKEVFVLTGVLERSPGTIDQRSLLLAKNQITDSKLLEICRNAEGDGTKILIGPRDVTTVGQNFLGFIPRVTAEILGRPDAAREARLGAALRAKDEIHKGFVADFYKHQQNQQLKH